MKSKSLLLSCLSEFSAFETEAQFWNWLEKTLMPKKDFSKKFDSICKKANLDAVDSVILLMTLCNSLAPIKVFLIPALIPYLRREISYFTEVKNTDSEPNKEFSLLIHEDGKCQDALIDYFYLSEVSGLPEILKSVGHLYPHREGFKALPMIWPTLTSQFIRKIINQPKKYCGIWNTTHVDDEILQLSTFTDRFLFVINATELQNFIPNQLKNLVTWCWLNDAICVVIADQSALVAMVEKIEACTQAIPLIVWWEGHGGSSRHVSTSRILLDGSHSYSSRSFKENLLWGKCVQALGACIDEKVVQKCQSLFPYGPSRIVSIVLKYLSLDSKEIKNEFEVLAQLAKGFASNHLDFLARKVIPQYQWKDLIFSEKTALRLAEVYHFIAQGGVLEKDWHFRRKHSRGHGVTVVFKGESGTGKTMAAEALAHRLGMDLYQVDLANITSKYVGETQKNLSRIFQAARESSGILFFDEGETLFSRRTQGTGVQDKYANLEINFLLQEMETYDGITIISTNLAHHIDPAFLRRITFEVEFPRPDTSVRESIWRHHCEGGLPISKDVDFARLSEIPLSGGIIRNSVRLAAMKASQRGTELKMSDLLYGLKRETQKMGQSIEKDIFDPRQWQHLLPEWENQLASKALKELEGQGL